jgi:hypothetical protein
MTTAKFSNGHEATYTGKRKVGAAWMVEDRDGRIKTGFSIDTKAAQTNARRTAALAFQGTGAMGMNHPRPHPAYMAMREKRAKERGFNSYSEWLNGEQEALNDWLETEVKIEVVAL